MKDPRAKMRPRKKNARRRRDARRDDREVARVLIDALRRILAIRER